MRLQMTNYSYINLSEINNILLLVCIKLLHRIDFGDSRKVRNICRKLCTTNFMCSYVQIILHVTGVRNSCVSHSRLPEDVQYPRNENEGRKTREMFTSIYQQYKE